MRRHLRPRSPGLVQLDNRPAAISILRHPLCNHLAAQPIISTAALCQLFDLPLVSQCLSCVGGPVASAAKLFVVSECFITVVQEPYNVLGRP